MAGEVLVVNGSPRANGNSSYLTGKLLEGIRDADAGAPVEVVNLRVLTVGPCRGCDGCRREGRGGAYCVLKDDMAGLYPKVVGCRALVLISPIYWFSVTAQMKAFIDRLYGLDLGRTHSLVGKPVGIVLVYADKDPYISGAANALRTLEDSFKWTGSLVKGMAYGTADSPGDAANNADLCRSVFELGRALVGG